MQFNLAFLDQPDPPDPPVTAGTSSTNPRASRRSRFSFASSPAWLSARSMKETTMNERTDDYSTRYGIVHVDFKTQKSPPKLSATGFKEAARRNAVV